MARRPIRITDYTRLQPANDAALRLDIEVSELRYDLNPRSVHAKRLVTIREAVLDARRLIEDFQNEIAEDKGPHYTVRAANQPTDLWFVRDEATLQPVNHSPNDWLFHTKREATAFAAEKEAQR